MKVTLKHPVREGNIVTRLVVIGECGTDISASAWFGESGNKFSLAGLEETGLIKSQIDGIIEAIETGEYEIMVDDPESGAKLVKGKPAQFVKDKEADEDYKFALAA